MKYQETILVIAIAGIVVAIHYLHQLWKFKKALQLRREIRVARLIKKFRVIENMNEQELTIALSTMSDQELIDLADVLINHSEQTENNRNVADICMELLIKTHIKH